MTNRSWDTSNGVTNAFYFNVGLHAQHHVDSKIPFNELQLVSKHELPYGYFCQFLLTKYCNDSWNWIIERRKNQQI